MSVSVTAFLNEKDNTLYFEIDGARVFEVPINELLEVIQVCWGDSLMGLTPESLWIFHGLRKSFSTPWNIRDWKSGHYVKAKLFSTRPDIQRSEVICSTPPKQFARVPHLTSLLPALWHIEPMCLDSQVVQNFLAVSKVDSVPEFTEWGD